MGLTSMNKNRAILLTGKTGTGKSTKAKTFVENPHITYANNIDFDVTCFPIENGIIIEDIHYKPDKEAILNILRLYKGQVVITSINEKSVPKEIKSMCKVKRAGSNNFLKEELQAIAPHSVAPVTYERDTFSLIYEYLKETDRELIRELLLFNKPSDTQIISWLAENMHPNRLIFVDGVVKRRWSQRYFYEMLAYAHQGNMVGRMTMPKRRQYSKIPSLSRRLKVKNPDVLMQLLQDEQFREHAKKRLNNSECRFVGYWRKEKKKEN